MKIWTWMKDGPFVLGGNCNFHPCHTEVEANGPFDIGKGLSACIVIAPNGKTVVVCAESGGIVGYSLDKVKKDVSEGDLKTMRKQIEEAKVDLASSKAKEKSPGDFWKTLGEL